MRTNPWVAWPAGTDPAALAARVRSAHESFLSGAPIGPVRSVVLESWRRSRSSGVDPARPRVQVDLGAADLAAYRAGHALAPLMPIVRGLLLDGTGADGLVVAVADHRGRLLWVEGDRGVRRAVERAGFVEGATWDEGAAGTNAPGVALAKDHAVQVFAAEHFAAAVQPWSCSAAPIHAPDGRVLGVLDITGGDIAAAPHALQLVRATVAAMESELAVRALRAATSRHAATARRPLRADAVQQPDDEATLVPTADPALRPDPASTARHMTKAPTATPPPPARLDVLGQAGAVLVLDPQSAADQHEELGLRHSEVLLLLAAHPEGLSAERLACELHERTLSGVTVRAEVSRLRRVVGPLLGPSRPYRLAAPLVTDADAVRVHLARGDVAAGVRAYRGPVLPRSTAPGVVRLREELDAEVRAAVEATDDVAAVLAWTCSAHGADDWSAWRRLTALAPPGSPAAARARAHLTLLERELGAG
ncbi:GAF domain-containing protein [Actinotalea subterranea]|uniref:GAF domain-containing protein n=1 Tax=Actinotalea subterranea TaxID=2607497 RepID=UPI00165D594A|nr:GAF domain-containing protein [Actinotalea subterranea]